MLKGKVKACFLACFVYMALASTAVYAEAPELRTVMPNSWRKVTRLEQEEERQFLRENKVLLEKVLVEGRRIYKNDVFFVIHSNNLNRITRVYREQAGEDTFYRLVTANSETPDFGDQEKIQFLQTLVYDYRGLMVILAYGTYNEIETGQRHTSEQYHALDIIKAGNRAKGILITPVSYFIIDSGEKRTYSGLIKGQVSGGGTATYFLMEDILRVLDSNSAITVHMPLDGYFSIGDAPRIRIESSSCLIDPDIPLRYSLQNAFDGDPATSYVENTEDDLMEIQFIFSGLIQKIAVINGYGASENLYWANNRVKNIAEEEFKLLPNGKYSNALIGEKHLLQDSTLTYQLLDYWSNGYLFITDLYKGDRYNDTCIAELNILTDTHGWLFGDIADE
jgi:hypothetical protein